MLLANVNQPVTIDQIIEALWGDRAPRRPEASIRAYVSNLRRALAPGDDDPKSVLVTESGAYRLAIGRSRLDATRFEDAVTPIIAGGEGESSLDVLAQRLDAALEGVGGEPFADFPYDEFARVETARLAELVLLARERRCEIAVDLGQGASWLPTISALIAAHPLRERLRAAHMRSLVAAGRHGEALRSFGEHRKRLIEDMGIEPGPALRALELDILALDDVEVASSGDLLDSTTEATEAAAPSVDAGPIERRTVTSIAIVRRPDQDAPVDPEDLEQLLEESRVRWREILSRYDAVVETIPDGLLGHVGFPTARERDAERAIRAAFEVVEGGSCAAGVATGTVLVTPGSDGATFTGESPSTAVRLAMNGPTSSVSAAPHTQRLTDDRVTYETIDGSVVVADLEPATTMATHGTLVGRDEELALAHRVADEARTGRGRVLVVTGQAGIGKTAFVERVAHEVGIPVLRFVGSPFHADTALWPVATALSDHPDLDLPDLLEVWANEGVDALVEAAPDPADRRSILLDTAVDAIFDRAEREPLMCVFEDVHSMDASTLELISELSQAAPSVSLLVVVAIRGNDSMGFADAEHATTIGLGPLGEGSAHEMIAGVADAGLSDEIVSAIVARGGGVPLFIEELTRSIGSASGDQSSAVAVIPESVQDLLMARLDAVPSARTTLHVAAAAGNAFTEDLVTAVAEDRSGLRSELDELCEAGVLVRERHRRGVRYRFRHALIRDTAYESIPKSRRVELHANIARAMADSESSDVAVEALARHLEAAGESQDALAAWLRAANASLAVSALSEAGESVRRGLAIADSLDGEGRTAVVEEIADLWLARGVIETQEHGPASDAAVGVYEHLLTELGAGLTDAQRFRALWGRWFGLSTRWNTTEALVAAEEVHRAAEASGDAALQIEGHHVMWATLLTVGEFARSLEHTRSARALYNRADHHWLTYEFGGHDPEVCMHSISGVSLWLLGRHDEARTEVAAAPALGDQLNHAYSRLEASFGPVTIAVLEGDSDALRSEADALERLAEAGSLPTGAEGYIDGCRGIASVADGDLAAGVPVLEQAAAAWADLWGSYCLPFDGRLAIALADADRVDDALGGLDRILERADRGRWWDSELRRARGRVLERAGRTEAAIVDYETARDLAASQQATTLVHRALVDIERLSGQTSR